MRVTCGMARSLRCANHYSGGGKIRGLSAYILIFALIVSSQTAFACQDLTLESSFAESDIVFVGTLKAVSKLQETADGRRPSDAFFEVTKVVKGDIPQAITIRDVGDNCYGFPQFSMQGYALPKPSSDRPVSREYLVFAVRNNDGSYRTFHPLGNTWMTDEEPYVEFKERAVSFIGRQQLERSSDKL
jgi:hypothetical protein